MPVDYEFEDFEADLRDALGSLYDPIYEAPERLAAKLGCGARHRGSCVQNLVLEAIDRMEPAQSVPSSVPAVRYYQLLKSRYVEDMTQDSAAERLCITPRHLRGLQWKAVRALAKSLWNGTIEPSHPVVEAPFSEEGRQHTLPNDASWALQLEKEVASLRRTVPWTEASIRDTITGAAELMRNMTSEHGNEFAMRLPDQDMTVKTHPSVLRQLVLTAVLELTSASSTGTVTLSAHRQHEHALVEASISPPVASDTLDLSFVRSILASGMGSAVVQAEAARTTVAMTLPLTPAHPKTVTVLVVEDNEDSVELYRSYVEDTPYRIVHLPDPATIFTAFDTCHPDVIVLDVMLPQRDLDGWQLLVSLHEHPVTRSIPVLVCSVVPQKEFAISLGAAGHLSKPARRSQFVRALDQAISQARVGS